MFSYQNILRPGLLIAAAVALTLGFAAPAQAGHECGLAGEEN